METPGSEAAVTMLGRGEEGDGFYDLEHLPPLLEDEENVSLADILSLRDSCLSEEEVWAVCAECVVALQSIRPSHLFHTLCITPDTLAFNAHGNVCFMEQLSDDPEGSFVPPEFDSTGSTFEGHVYSLGSTLSAALNFVIEPELEADLGEEIQKLLEQMQEETPEDRPLLQDILSLAEARLSPASSAAVCRKLSSVGRRVLSIESVSTFQDGQEGSWEARWQHPKPRCLLKRLSSDDNTKEPCVDTSAKANGVSRKQVCGGWDSSLWAEDIDGSEGDGLILADELDCRSYNSSPVRRRAQQRLTRGRGALNRSCSVPDSNNPPCLSPAAHGDISVPVSDLSEIGADERLSCRSMWSNRLERLERGKSCESYPHTSSAEDYGNSFVDRKMSEENEDTAETLCGAETNILEDPECESINCTQDSASPCTSCQDLEQEQDSSKEQSSLNHSLYIPNNYMTKSMLCLNEESQDEWISLRELLTRCERRLTVNELWALCYTCLSSLQTYIDFPTYLCLDTVHVGSEGEVLFLKPKNIGAIDEFFLAPEYQDHGIVTEKVCVYGVAAILWATAKFSLSPNQKLAMPRKLKRLLLEMAKRTPIERPSIVMAKKSCRDYLARQGTSAETVWSDLISRVHPPASKPSDADALNSSDTHQSSCEESVLNNSGFVPTATESRLAPVPGPVPYSYPVHKELQLPEAFTSTATHFTPIILTSEGDFEGEAPDPGAAIEGTVDGLQKSCESIEDRGLDFTTRPEYSYCTRSEPNLQTQELPVSQAGLTTTCSEDTLANNASSFTDTSCMEVSLPQQLSSNLNGCGVFNNYLFHQDPRTGHLSLVPVHVRAPESFQGLDINLSLVPQPLQRLITAPERSDDDQCNNCLDEPEHQHYDPTSYFFKGSSIISDNTLEHSSPRAHYRQTDSETQGEDRSPPDSISSKVHPALQEVIDLLKGEFSLNGGLDNGHEDIAMGEYIFSLKDLQYHIFAGVVRERFSHLYWEEDLLGVLHCLVNYSPSTLVSNEQPSSKRVEKEAVTPASIATVWAERREVCLHGCLDLNGNIHTSRPAAVVSWDRAEAQTCHRENKASLEDLKISSDESQHLISGGMSTDGSDAGVMEGGEYSAGGSDESPSEAECLSGRDEGLTGAHDEQMSPDCSEDMEDSDSVVSERLILPGSRAEGQSFSFSPAWALAFYGEDCFSPEVIKYAGNLGQHTESPCVDVKTQELQQQLMIETRNLKKTRNFYQKLIQQERKNKGPDNKLMVFKLKTQLEELRSKVVFLDSVKKYLEVLSVDQWGLEVSLLPSLAVCGPGSLDLQSSEDPSILSFGTSKGKRTLQAGSPEGLMAYLYARNAAVEGYIQQFLYTYRFLCTPEQLLHFIMHKFISAARQGPDMSGDSEKIFHRSLDLLQLWVTDCRLVDFTSNPRLMETLENFLNTEVIPIDSQGEAILAALHSPQCKTWSRVRGSLTSFEDDDDDSQSVHSSTEDLGRKWRFSRVVESSSSLPKEKAFSIAAALPMPCYGSMLDDLSNVCLHGEERIPFSQSENSAQHIAQQLTLLEQEMFQGCHPVHFLNSRSQGIRNKVSTPNRNVSQHVLPAEGSSLLDCEGTPSDSFLQRLLAYADRVTNWISAEIVICDSVKTQAAVLTKYLWVGKHCYEARNFATAMQVLGGLENVIVRQIPAWKHLSSKVCEILEELRAVQVFLKSDDLCLMGGGHTRKRPTLPSAYIFAMHVQQREIGAFTLTTGAYKWTKLRSIAKVVSQVHAFQEAACSCTPDRELQAYLRSRISRFAASDIHLLAADNDANFQQTSERQTRRIQDTLRKVKATFQ